MELLELLTVSRHPRALDRGNWRWRAGSGVCTCPKTIQFDLRHPFSYPTLDQIFYLRLQADLKTHQNVLSTSTFTPPSNPHWHLHEDVLRPPHHINLHLLPPNPTALCRPLRHPLFPSSPRRRVSNQGTSLLRLHNTSPRNPPRRPELLPRRLGRLHRRSLPAHAQANRLRYRGARPCRAESGALQRDGYDGGGEGEGGSEESAHPVGVHWGKA